MEHPVPTYRVEYAMSLLDSMNAWLDRADTSMVAAAIVGAIFVVSLVLYRVLTPISRVVFESRRRP